MSDEVPEAEPVIGESAATPGAPPSRKKGIVLIGVLVGALVAGVAGGLLAIGPVVARRAGLVVSDSLLAVMAADTMAAEGEEGGEQGGGEGGDGEHGGKEGEGGKATNLHLIDNLVLNPAGSGGTRFLMVATAVEFGDASFVDQFKARDAEVRDIVLRVIGSKTVEQLADMSTRESLRREVADSLILLVPKAQRGKSIRRVFFPQFVIQ